MGQPWLRGIVLFALLPALARSASADRAATAAASEVERQAAARALFEEGLAHADAERWQEAADRFERAGALRSTPAIQYNLSTALVHLMRLVRASELLRQIAGAAETPPDVRAAAEARLSQVLPRLAHLTVHAPPSGDGTVVLDGRPLPPPMLGVALPVDPAWHAVELRRGPNVVVSVPVSLREGERRAIRLHALLPATPVAAAPLEGAPPLPADTDRSWARSWWFWLLVGSATIGVAAVATAATRGGSAEPRGNVDTWRLEGP